MLLSLRLCCNAILYAVPSAGDAVVLVKKGASLCSLDRSASVVNGLAWNIDPNLSLICVWLTSASSYLSPRVSFVLSEIS